MVPGVLPLLPLSLVTWSDRLSFRGHASHGLAIDRDHSRENSRDRCHPGDEAALNLIGIQSGEDVAKVIMGWPAILERAEPGEQSQLLGVEEGDLGEALRTLIYPLILYPVKSMA